MVSYTTSENIFKFGAGEPIQSIQKVRFPATTGKTSVYIESDIVNTHIPLLLSKDAMKKAETSINFLNDTVTMLGQKQNVIATSSGHYAIPLNENKQALEEVKKGKITKIILHVNTPELKNDKKKIAKKLHSQFSHPQANKLIKN